MLVLRKIYVKNHINIFIGVPLSTKTQNKSGFMYHKCINSKGRKVVALLAQTRAFDTSRVSDYCNEKIRPDDIKKIRQKLSEIINIPSTKTR